MYSGYDQTNPRLPTRKSKPSLSISTVCGRPIAIRRTSSASTTPTTISPRSAHSDDAGTTHGAQLPIFSKSLCSNPDTVKAAATPALHPGRRDRQSRSEFGLRPPIVTRCRLGTLQTRAPEDRRNILATYDLPDSRGQLVSSAFRQIRSQGIELAGNVVAKAHDQLSSGSGQRDPASPPVAVIARPANERTGFGTVDQPCEAGLLQVERLAQLGHPDGATREDTEQLGVLRRQAMAEACVAETPLHHKA